jgi:GNAT superfamily N-acetyltransferase
MSVAAIRHFLDLIDIPPRELSGIIEASRAMKKRVRGRAARPLDGRTLAMIFDKPSTRTRVSFDVAKDRTMSDNLTVRFVAKSDFDRWLPLWDGYNAFYGRSGKTALAREITEMTWARFFDGYELVHGLVAESNGALLGLTHYLFHRSTIAIEPVCYLQDLFTAEASRRKGVGRALIEEVYRQAKLSGCGRVYWHTQETNRTARALYDKVAEHLGFIRYHKQF